MQADSRLGRLVGALARRNADQFVDSAHGIPRDSRLGLLIGALARTPLPVPHEAEIHIPVDDSDYGYVHQTGRLRVPDEGHPDALSLPPLLVSARFFPGELDLLGTFDLDDAVDFVDTLVPMSDIASNLRQALERDLQHDLGTELSNFPERTLLFVCGFARELRLFGDLDVLSHLSNFDDHNHSVSIDLHRRGYSGIDAGRALDLARVIARADARERVLAMILARHLAESLARAVELARAIANSRAPHIIYLWHGAGIDDSVSKAKKFAYELAKVPVDASGADLTGISDEHPEALAGVIWNGQTMWQPGLRHWVREHSEEIGPGRYRVVGESERGNADVIPS